MIEIVQNQVCKVQIGHILCLTGCSARFISGKGIQQILHLCIIDFQIQLADQIQRIADLMGNAKGNQGIRTQIGIHMRMQITVELAVRKYIRLEDRLIGSVFILLGL